MDTTYTLGFIKSVTVCAEVTGARVEGPTEAQRQGNMDAAGRKAPENLCAGLSHPFVPLHKGAPLRWSGTDLLLSPLPHS